MPVQGSDSEDYDAVRVNTDFPLGKDGMSTAQHHRPRVDRPRVDRPRVGDEARLAALTDEGGRLRRPSETIELDGRPGTRFVLEETQETGKYILTADDPEVQEILNMGIAREQAVSSGARTRIRDLVFTRQFTTFDRQNPLSNESPFHGFFTLFWLAMVLMFCKVSAENYRQYGSILGTNEVMQLMFRRDVIVLGITDLAMLASTSLGLLLQKAIARGWLKWSTSGWIIQNVWQSTFLASIIGWTYYREWPWTHTIFMVLHTVVFLMKQHSYACYNGHLSGVYQRRQMLARRAKELDGRDTPEVGMTTGIDGGAKVSLPKSRVQLDSGEPTSTDMNAEVSDVARVSKAIESGKPLDNDQIRAFARVISTEIADLDLLLKGKSNANANAYPHNLTWRNFLDWTCLPTLVYELEYPRQEKINWWYVVEKTSATFGVIGVMMVISQAYIYPAVAQAVGMKAAGMTLRERWAELPWLVSDMLFPLLLEQLLSWYVIWECVLNVLAEITRFADRGFYGDWWNSVSFEAYARDWNRPVHNFLLRHVYHSSISTFKLSRGSATFLTFLLSALVHEMVMACLFKTVRGYLFTMQLLQVPLVSLSRTKWMKGHNLIGNVVFWIGLFIGPAVLTSLYLLI